MNENEKILSELERMGRLLAAIAVRDRDKRDAALILAHAGYSFVETGQMLGISRNAAQLLVQRAKKRRARTTESK